MYGVFDESLLTSFHEGVQKELLEIFDGYGMPAFQQSQREGMNRTGCTIKQRVMEWIDN